MTQMKNNCQAPNPARAYSGYHAPCQGQQPNPCDSMNQTQLLNYLCEVSFAVDDVLLYLDTHPCDCEALAYCSEMTCLREAALKTYAKHFGPLCIDTAAECKQDRWAWITQPFPWESKGKGGCR